MCFPAVDPLLLGHMLNDGGEGVDESDHWEGGENGDVPEAPIVLD